MRCLTIVSVALAMLLVPAALASAALVDDFSSDTSSLYTAVVTGGGSPPSAYRLDGGNFAPILTPYYTSGLYYRNDRLFNVGDTVKMDIVNLTSGGVDGDGDADTRYQSRAGFGLSKSMATTAEHSLFVYKQHAGNDFNADGAWVAMPADLIFTTAADLSLTRTSDTSYDYLLNYTTTTGPGSINGTKDNLTAGPYYFGIWTAKSRLNLNDIAVRVDNLNGPDVPELAFLAEARANPVELSEPHIAAIKRQRRLIVGFDNGALFWGNQSVENPPGEVDLAKHVARCFSVIDDPDSQVDSVWWDWSQGNIAAYPSKVLPTYEFFPLWKEWFKSGVDPVRVFLEETRKRKREVFYSYRVNGPDAHELPYSPFKDGHPLKKAHPEWLLWAEDNIAARAITHAQWNFAEPGVRELKVRILEELARNYQFDGIHLDFYRNPPLVPSASAWKHRDAITQFMRDLRAKLLEVETQTGRPILLSAQVAPSLAESHMDGLDPETWAREQLVDLLVVGCRSSEVDLEAYRRITAGTHIKLYPTWDDYHSSDGYRHQPLEHLRGVFANWWSQGADGLHCFNFDNEIRPDPFPDHPLASQRNRQVYREIGSPETLKLKDKFFVVERRGWDSANYRTAREAFISGNMLAQLPAEIANNAREDTLLRVRVGDDVNVLAERIDQLSVHLLLSDPAAKDLPEDQRIASAMIRKTLPWGPFEGMEGRLYTIAPANGIESRVQVRLNNILLENPVIEDGWLVFRNVPPALFALGENLIGVGLAPIVSASGQRMVIEKLEVHVKYR